jgi:hypothetical protein
VPANVSTRAAERFLACSSRKKPHAIVVRSPGPATQGFRERSRHGLGRVLINPLFSRCPLCSESDRSAALPRAQDNRPGRRTARKKDD